MQEPKPCVGAHTIGGKVPTISDTQFVNHICDCGRFVMSIQGCGCNGTSKKVVLKPNTHYAASK